MSDTTHRASPAKFPCLLITALLLGLTACGGGGSDDANDRPVADANGPYSGTAGTAISFSSAGSSDPDGNITDYTWNFGDGGNSSVANPGHTYAAAGNYTVTLTVTDNDGASTTDSTSASVQNPQQQACSISVNPTTLPFGNTSVGAASTLDTTVSNSGAIVCNVALTLTGSSDFTLLTAANFNVNPGASQTVSVRYMPGGAGTDSGTLAVASNDPGTPGVDVALSGTGIAQQGCVPVNPNGISINSTARSGCPDATVPQAARVANTSFSILAINDLGMHCGDLDTRIASILPPFQVLLAQVIQKGNDPVLNPAGIDVFYSAASSPNDPALASTVFDGLQDDGTTYKTNFWDFPVPAGTYDPFYPAFNPFNQTQSLTPLAGPPFNVSADVGLPVPNVEDLYIGHDGQVNSGDESLTAVLHAMPGMAAPYTANDPLQAQEHYSDKPFFVDFPFGYVAEDVNWYEAAGIPFAAFDDNGRENAYPLVRVEARQGNTTVSTVDTVLPISGEASCVNCHADPVDLASVNGTTSRSTAPTDALSAAGLPVVTSIEDPDGNLPARVSLEYASDINTLRLHDLRHGASYVTPTGNDTVAASPCDIHANSNNGDASCLTNRALIQNEPVVCQVCHYTPALDLAQLGPLTGPAGTIANGRNHLHHRSNSNVMHSHHGSTGAFPDIPAPIQAGDGTITNQPARLTALEESCYQCHPGTNVQCLRGAMFNGGMLCSDCHGDMQQVGNDFTATVSVSNPGPGAWVLNGNFYTDASQPRVPWANEPGCGSCHTGDASNNMAGDPGTLTNIRDIDGNTDGIRLRQAWLTGDAKATPIVPTNKRFAEPVVPASFNGFSNPGAGNPQLYRVSTGHGGVMCEGCHGATHAEWPNANPNANDNITADQLQGHVGTIIECDTCHTNINALGTNGSTSSLRGPHGMHVVGDTNFADGGHESNINRNACRACHGQNGEGSVLSRTAADRNLPDVGFVPKGTPISCDMCHSNEL